MENDDIYVKSSEETKHDNEIFLKNHVALFLQDDNTKLAEALDDLKGSYAVECILQELLRKGNTHTLYSVLELIQKNRK